MKLAFPRLLPVTIGVMATLLGVKSVSLVRAASPHAEAAAPAAPDRHAHPPTPTPTPAPASVPASAATAPPVLPPQPAPVSDSERALLGDLRQRRTELESRARALELREQVQQAAEHRLGARLDELTVLQRRLEQMEQARDAHDAANWRAMVKLYETMKPREAATIFNELDRPVLLQILDRMQERRASLVLAAMLPERAREITAALAAMRTKADAVPDAPMQGRTGVAGK